MYITHNKSRQNGKTYTCVLLRESYRENGKVKNLTIANLSHCKPEEIKAIEFALKHKNNLDALVSLADDVEIHEGLSVGAVWTGLSVARRLGIVEALGKSRQGKLALWLVLARLIDQGSRLSAVRLAMDHAACDCLGIEDGFSEDDLYETLTWLANHQEEIENRLFRKRHSDNPPNLFLYDVTSSYLEGDCNELGAYGYNRDKKKGKKQIVIGLLCDADGAPLTVEVFEGSTSDVSTFASQVNKAADRFGVKDVTFVGDRGMIKTAGIKDLSEHGFHYISALTKPQVEKLIERNVVQLDMFDDDVFEVQSDGERYVLRRNPVRAEELESARRDKERYINDYIEKRNKYLLEHPRAHVDVALRKVSERIAQLNIGGWLSAEADGRAIRLLINDEALASMSRLDGCYVIRTDLPRHTADARTVHDRYKDLAEVEWAFRTFKTTHLEVRPIYVRKEENTRAHVLVVMLAYLIERELRRAWAGLDITVEEGLKRLTTLSSLKVLQKKTGGEAHQIAKPRELSSQLLEAAHVRLPEALPSMGAKVVTRRKLPTRRISQ